MAVTENGTTIAAPTQGAQQKQSASKASNNSLRVENINNANNTPGRDSFVSVSDNDADFYQCVASPVENSNTFMSTANTTMATESVSHNTKDFFHSNENATMFHTADLQQLRAETIANNIEESKFVTMTRQETVTMPSSNNDVFGDDLLRAPPANEISAPEQRRSSEKSSESNKSNNSIQQDLLAQLMNELASGDNLSTEKMRELGMKLLATGAGIENMDFSTASKASSSENNTCTTIQMSKVQQPASMVKSDSAAKTTVADSVNSSNGQEGVMSQQLDCIEIDEKIVDEVLDNLDGNHLRSNDEKPASSHSGLMSDMSFLSDFESQTGASPMSMFDGTSLSSHHDFSFNNSAAGLELFKERKKQERKDKKKKKPRLPCKYCEIHYPSNAYAHTTKMCFHLNKNGKDVDDPEITSQTFPCQFCLRRYPNNAQLHSTEMCFHLNKGGQKNREQIALALNAAARAEAAVATVGAVAPRSTENSAAIPVVTHHSHTTTPATSFPCRYCIRRNPIKAMEHSSEMCPHVAAKGASHMGSNYSQYGKAGHQASMASASTTVPSSYGSRYYDQGTSSGVNRSGISSGYQAASEYEMPGSTHSNPNVMSSAHSEHMNSFDKYQPHIIRSYANGAKMRERRETSKQTMDQYYANHYYNAAAQLVEQQQHAVAAAASMTSGGYGSTSFHNENNSSFADHGASSMFGAASAGTSAAGTSSQEHRAALLAKNKENLISSSPKPQYLGHHESGSGVTITYPGAGADERVRAYENFGIPEKMETNPNYGKPPGLD